MRIICHDQLMPNTDELRFKTK